MALLEIKKIGTKNFWHYYNDNEYSSSDIVVDFEGDYIQLTRSNGAFIFKKKGFLFSDVSVYDVNGSEEVFTSIEALENRLISLAYIAYYNEGVIDPNDALLDTFALKTTVNIIQSDLNTEESIRSSADSNLQTQIDAFAQGNIGVLMIADTPVIDGTYIAGESGTYINAGDGTLVVDLTNTLTYIVVADTQTTFSKIEIPINTLGYLVISTLSQFNALITAGTSGNWLITDDIVLDANKIIPNGVTLHFNGGVISGAYTLTGDNTDIEAPLTTIFSTDVLFSGDWSVKETYPQWFGLVGDGSDEYDALNSAIQFGKNIEFPKDMEITYSTTLEITGKHVDFNGAILTYTGAVDTFAMVFNSGGDSYKNGLEKFNLISTSTNITNRTHGLNLGGSNAYCRDFKITGFTGISLSLGSGVESYTGVTLPSSNKCYYYDINNFTINPTSGWCLVVQSSNNANRFSNISTFPYDGFSETAPRSYNCINEIVIDGLSNQFDRVSLEASPSSERIYFSSNANSNLFNGTVYFEYNTSWEIPTFPKITLSSTSSNNIIENIRHPSSGNVVNDLGTANDVSVRPSYYINGQQLLQPFISPNMVTNGNFNGGASTSWSDFSTNGTPSFGTGYFNGSSWRIDVVSGRPSMYQNLVSVGGYNASALVGMNITAGCWMKTDLDGVQLRIGNNRNNVVLNDGNWHFITSTIKLASGTSIPIQVTTSSTTLTGYVEISNVTAVIGNKPLAF